jgi:MFS superfamily sulfate permease-like transporter
VSNANALGDDTDYEGEFEFEQVADGQNSILKLIRSFVDFNCGITNITLTCLVLMVVWDIIAKKKVKIFQAIPSSLMAVGLGILINEMYAVRRPEYFFGNSSVHVVTVPLFKTMKDFKGTFISPYFTFLANPEIYTVTITLAIVGSLESLLSLEAADSIDTEKDFHRLIKN